MKNIVTITFNPAIDKSTMVTSLIPEKKLKCAAPKFEPGGGGINVSKALNKLGITSTAVYLAGGYTGLFFRDLLKKEISSELMIEIQGHTRENMIVFESTTSKQYRFGMPGPLVQEKEWKNILAAVEELTETEFLIASGSISEGIPTDIFAQIAKIAKRKNIKLIVDTSGEALRLAVDEGVFLVKPNLNELSLLNNDEEMSFEKAAEKSKSLVSDSKCKYVVVSLGAMGAMLVSESETIQFIPPDVKKMSTVGAGDSMVAGIIKYLADNRSIHEAVKYGVSCGSAATMNPGTELCNRADAENLYSLITEKKIG